MVSSSRATSVGPAAVAGAWVSVIAATLRQLAPTVVTASRTDGSTANDCHVRTADDGSVTSSTMQNSASHRVGVDGVPGVATVLELGADHAGKSATAPWKLAGTRPFDEIDVDTNSIPMPGSWPTAARWMSPVSTIVRGVWTAAENSMRSRAGA